MASQSNVSQVAKTVERAAKQYDSLLIRLIAALLRSWRTVDPYRGQSVSAAASRSVVLIEQSQRSARAIAAAEQRMLMRILGVPEKSLPKSIGKSYPRANANIYDVWNRPAEQFRYAASRNKGGSVEAIKRIEDENILDEAVKAMKNRVVQLAQTELQLAARDEVKRALDSFDGVKYYRRVIHPELSRTGSCGLCVIAADRVYKKSVLLPLHDGCHCTVVPILGPIMGDGDPGGRLNREELDLIYEAAGSNRRDDLRKIRLADFTHGELGPILVQEGYAEDGSRNFTPYDEYGDVSTPMWQDVREIAGLRVAMGGSDAEKSAHEALAQTASAYI